jgi:hypothetical protein
MALGSTQPLTEMSTRNLPGVKEVGGEGVRLTTSRRLWADCPEIVGASTSQPYGPPRPVTWIDRMFIILYGLYFIYYCGHSINNMKILAF